MQVRQPPNNSAVSGLKILIAEDDETSEMLLDIEVKTFCKEILKVRTGVEVVEICLDNPDIDLTLMDITSPSFATRGNWSYVFNGKMKYFFYLFLLLETTNH